MPIAYRMCKETFSRCSYILHASQSKCNSNPKTPDSSLKLVSSNIVQHSPLNSALQNKNSNELSMEVLENGSLFMEVTLGKENEKPEKEKAIEMNAAEVLEESYQILGNESNIFPIVPNLDIDVMEVIDCSNISEFLDLEEKNEATMYDQIKDFTPLSMEEGENALINQDEGTWNTLPNLVQVEALPPSEVEAPPPNDVEAPPPNEIEAPPPNEVEAPPPYECQAPKGLTNLGHPRKRAPPKKKDEIQTKRLKNKDKNEIQPPCNESCKRKCLEKIPQHRRGSIYEQFWDLEDNERKVFILDYVGKSIVGRRTPEEESRRAKTFIYNLSTADGEKKSVCKTFFLATLGYNKKNDMFVMNRLNLAKEGISPKQDMQGRHTAHNFIDRNVIKSHILKYNPRVSHYRREHAPNRKYLPSELTIVQMFSDFCCNHKDVTCSYDLYRCVIAEMNISFTKLAHEECERCTRYKQHNADHVKNVEESCVVCTEWSLHHDKYIEARKMYEASVDENKIGEYHQSGTVVYSMDLQKVIMLPQMEQFKEIVFTRRIVVFNESFVPLDKKQKILSIACLWHEGISGRKKEDIASALQAFLECNRDAKKIVIWLDNCYSQNKNRAQFSHLVGVVNSNVIEAKSIELNYLEPGHTFMSADHFHHQVTQQVKSKAKDYDFSDFEDCVKKSCSGKVQVKSLQSTDFFLLFDYSSIFKITKKTPLPYLNDMVQVVFKRGSLDLYYRTKFAGESCEISFLKTGFLKKKSVPTPEKRKTERGVNRLKKVILLQN